MKKKIFFFFAQKPPDPDGKFSCREIITHKGHFCFPCSYLVQYMYSSTYMLCFILIRFCLIRQRLILKSDSGAKLFLSLDIARNCISLV